MYRAYLARVDTVFLNHRITCQVAHAHDVVSFLHTAFLNRENGRIDITATTVEIRRMDMDNQWFAADMFREHTRRISEPVVAVDDVEIQTVSQHTRHGLIVTDLLNQVIRITAGETDAT